MNKLSIVYVLLNTRSVECMSYRECALILYGFCWVGVLLVLSSIWICVPLSVHHWLWVLLCTQCIDYTFHWAWFYWVRVLLTARSIDCAFHCVPLSTRSIESWSPFWVCCSRVLLKHALLTVLPNKTPHFKVLVPVADHLAAALIKARRNGLTTVSWTHIGPPNALINLLPSRMRRACWRGVFAHRCRVKWRVDGRAQWAV